MLGGVVVAAANGGGQHHRQLDVPARHVGVLGQMVVDLVHADAKEVNKHQLHDRPQAGSGRASGGADEGGLRNRGVHDAVFAELLQQPAGGAKNAAISTNVFPHDEHRVVTLHFLGNGL